MPNPIFTPLGALVALLRGCPVKAIAWAPPQATLATGTVGSPYYDEVPEPAPAFPYVAIEMPESEPDHTFEGAYTELWTPTIYIVGLEANIEQISTPYGPPGASVFAWLDSFANQPTVLAGSGFEACGFYRLDWALKRDPERDVSGARVWVATAKYELNVNATYPLRSE